MLLFIKRLIGIGKKILLVIIVYFIIISLFIYFINKDKIKTTNDPIQNNRDEIYRTINNKKINSTKEGKFTVGVYRLITCGFIGEACTKNPSDGDKNYNKSIFGFTSNVVSLPFNNLPASGIYWAYSGLQNAGFIPKAYAAEGIGFAAIKPFIKVWSVFRNLAYIILVLVLIFIGFMIMFRMKINPQTVISVENSLPKIVVALLLITFSYAIAGFLIDLMYIIILIIISVLSSSNIDKYTSANSFNLINEYIGADLGKLYPVKFNLLTTGNYLISILPETLGGTLKFIGGYLAAFGISHWLLKKFLNDIDKEGYGLKDIGIQAMTFGLNVGSLPSWIGLIAYWILTLVIIMPLALPLVIGFLVFLTVILLMFRIFFLLLTNYIQILLLILFAPVILLFEAIPGKNSFSWWFKNLLANLIVFPFVILIIVTCDIIMKINAQVGTNQFWSPPFLYPLNQEAMTVLIGLGIYLILPDLIKMVKEMLGVKGMPFSIGLGTFFAGATAAWGGVHGGMGGITSLAQTPFLGQRILQAARDNPKGIFGSLFPQSYTDTLLRKIQKGDKS